jgi:crotonobetainyl-CoA:carnitine CoA-transferase CaiB-like acyl-CoA transferase
MGLSIIDFMTGITTAVAILAGLLGVARDGRGGDIDVSLFDVALHQLSYPGSWYMNEGLITGRVPRSGHPSATPVQLFRTADGWIFVMCMTEKFWQELCGAIARPDLLAHPDYITIAKRRENRDALTVVLDAVFEEATTADWLKRLQGLLPAAPVYDLPQALDNPYLATIGMVQPVPHPVKPDFRALSNPIKLDGQRLENRRAPALGEHSTEVLGALGYSADDIARLTG